MIHLNKNEKDTTYVSAKVLWISIGEKKFSPFLCPAKSLYHKIPRVHAKKWEVLFIHGNWLMLMMIILLCIIIPNRNFVLLKKIRRKRRGVKRKIPTEMMKEFIGKESVIYFFNTAGGVRGTILSIEENWIKVEEKKQQKIKQKINHKIKQNKEQNIEQNNKQNIEPNKGSNKKRKLLKKSCILLLLFIAIILLRPTWTPDIKGENSISEFRKVEINGAKLQMMIRGCDKNNPVLLFVHGGPCWSEIPYVVKYQKEWEKEFTIVHYDQRGSGKSYQFFRDYSDVSANTHVEDLVALTEYIKEYLGQEQVVLVGHSYGTYVAIQAAYYRPELYRAYVGIGQVSHKVEAELDNLNKYIAAAEQAGNTKDVEYLKSLQEPITNGDILAPRAYARKYGFSARKINDNLDYLKGFLFGPEYNLLDALRLYTASYLYQERLLKETSHDPITELVTEMKIPVYFLMGKYDGMTSPKVAEEYLNNLHVKCGEATSDSKKVAQQTSNFIENKGFILFEESAHFPQFEEKEAFFSWMKETFRESPKCR